MSDATLILFVAAGTLGVSMSQLAKLVRHDGKSFALVNDGRKSAGMPALK